MKLPAGKSVSEGDYEEIGRFFYSHFGPYAGWAHQILFAAELTSFRSIVEANPSSSDDSLTSNVAAKTPSSKKRARKDMAKDEVGETETETGLAKPAKVCIQCRRFARDFQKTISNTNNSL
jgi:hypothetical protein